MFVSSLKRSPTPARDLRPTSPAKALLPCSANDSHRKYPIKTIPYIPAIKNNSAMLHCSNLGGVCLELLVCICVSCKNKIQGVWPILSWVAAGCCLVVPTTTGCGSDPCLYLEIFKDVQFEEVLPEEIGTGQTVNSNPLSEVCFPDVISD